MKKMTFLSKRRMRAVFIVFTASFSCFSLLIGLKSAVASDIMKKKPRRVVHESRDAYKNNSRGDTSRFCANLFARLGDLGPTSGTSVKVTQRKIVNAASNDTLISLSVRLPKGHPFEWLVWYISQATANTSYSVSDCFIDEKKQRCVFSFASPGKKSPRVRLTVTRSERFQPGASKMAIVGEVVDDSAFQIVVSYLSISEPLSIALFPGKKQSTLISQLAGQYRKEVIIRLPLEPASKIPSSFTVPVIMVHFPQDKIRSIVSRAVVSVPHCSGFTNVWGSRALEDSRIMNIILSEIKKERDFFLESETARNSVVHALADTLGVPYGEVSGSIDDKTKQAGIQKKLRRFCLLAQKNGTAIITVPINVSFIAAFKAELPWLKKNGAEFVPVSEIINKPAEP